MSPEQRRRCPSCFIFALLALCAALPFSTAQSIQLGDLGQAKSSRGQRVSLDPEPLSVTADKAEWIELRFHVAPGFHVNSHVPHDETLIPTTLNLNPSPQYHSLKDEYPAGKPLHLSVGAGETLSTYDGEFRVRVEVVAAKGETALTGTLHYQACDAASCFPPRDLPVNVPMSAR